MSTPNPVQETYPPVAAAAHREEPATIEPAGYDAQPVATDGEQAGRTADKSDTGQPATADQRVVAEDEASAPAQLFDAEELQAVITRWRQIQAGFVDEPRQAIQDADTLVDELMQRLMTTFAAEREDLESRWSGGQDVSTEDLRRSLQRYRSFFERLLAA